MTNTEVPIHLVFKNGHLSDYHRHNDDLSIHLTKGDQVIFGDGGLYSHNQNDIGRQYAKSAWAHSTVFPVSQAEKKIKRKRLYKGPETACIDNTISGTTWLYHPNAILKREVFWGAEEGLKKFSILDSISAIKDTTEVVSCFLIPSYANEVNIDEKEGVVFFVSGGVECQITFDNNSVFPVLRGPSPEVIESSREVFVSRKMGERAEACRIEFFWRCERNSSSSRFGVFLN